jgi:hypothetical protein
MPWPVRRSSLERETDVFAAPLFGMSIYWHLPVLIVIVSLVYSATRYDQWGAILNESVRWGLRLAGFLVGIGVILYLVTVLTTLQLEIGAAILVVVAAAFSAITARA